MSVMDQLCRDLRAEGFDIMNDVGAGAFRVGSDPSDATDFAIYAFGASVSEDRGVWTISEPNASWIRVRSPHLVMEFLIRLRSARRDERASWLASTDQNLLTEADVQRREFPCQRCKRPFHFEVDPKIWASS